MARKPKVILGCEDCGIEFGGGAEPGDPCPNCDSDETIAVTLDVELDGDGNPLKPDPDDMADEEYDRFRDDLNDTDEAEVGDL